jgi:hypothetical protein
MKTLLQTTMTQSIQYSHSPYTVRVIQEQSTTPQRYIASMNPFDADLSKAATYARLETGTLKNVTDDYYYGCHCTSCLHTARLSLSRLRSQLGDDFPLIRIRDRLKCQICSSRKVTVTFLGPHEKGGNLHQLFQKEPR